MKTPVVALVNYNKIRAIVLSHTTIKVIILEMKDLKK